MSSRPPVDVDGVCCVRDHFNDHRALYCVICGISMLQQTARLVRRPRPPLGVLVWDDGSTTSLTHDLVIGRHPSSHPRVTSGEVEPLEVIDGAERLSRAHASVTLDAWEVLVTDLGSTNGTVHQVALTGTASRLVPQVPVRLADGDTIVMGARSFLFQSHHVG